MKESLGVPNLAFSKNEKALSMGLSPTTNSSICNVDDLTHNDEGIVSPNCSKNVEFTEDVETDGKVNQLDEVSEKVNLFDSNIDDETTNDHDETSNDDVVTSYDNDEISNGVQIVKDKITNVQSGSAMSGDKITSIRSKDQIEPRVGSGNTIRSTSRKLKPSALRLPLRDIQVERQLRPNRKYQPYHANVKQNRTNNSTNFIPPLLHPNNFTSRFNSRNYPARENENYNFKKHKYKNMKTNHR